MMCSFNAIHICYVMLYDMYTSSNCLRKTEWTDARTDVQTCKAGTYYVDYFPAYEIFLLET